MLAMGVSVVVGEGVAAVIVTTATKTATMVPMMKGAVGAERGWSKVTDEGDTNN